MPRVKRGAKRKARTTKRLPAAYRANALEVRHGGDRFVVKDVIMRGDGRIVQVHVSAPIKKVLTRKITNLKTYREIASSSTAERASRISSEEIIRRPYLEPLGQSEAGVKRIKAAVEAATLKRLRSHNKGK